MITWQDIIAMLGLLGTIILALSRRPLEKAQAGAAEGDEAAKVSQAWQPIVTTLTAQVETLKKENSDLETRFNALAKACADAKSEMTAEIAALRAQIQRTKRTH